MKLLAISTLLYVSLTPTSVNGNWWFLSRLSAVGTASHQATSVDDDSSSVMHNDAFSMCALVPGLTRTQRLMCQRRPQAMKAVADGVKLGVAECQRQFKGERWNCSAVENAGFGRLLLKLGSREAAFVYAISSAGVTHAMARACARGDLGTCECGRPDGRGQGVDKNGTPFTWGGCSDNVRFASRFVRNFVDSGEKESNDGRALMNVHNNRAGRSIVRRKMELECKCHGVSGSCTTKTCWKAVPSFEKVGKVLKRKYKRALQVTVSQQGAKLLPAASDMQFDQPLNNRVMSTRAHRSEKVGGAKPALKRVRRSDLVFFEPSPDYCEDNEHTGSMGTAGRPCNKTSSGADSCDLLCCGRGYDTKRVVVTEQCRCKFVWCCEVKCDTCRKVVDVHTCKGRASTRLKSTQPANIFTDASQYFNTFPTSTKGRRRLTQSSRFSVAGTWPTTGSEGSTAPQPVTTASHPSLFHISTQALTNSAIITTTSNGVTLFLHLLSIILLFCRNIS